MTERVDFYVLAEHRARAALRARLPARGEGLSGESRASSSGARTLAEAKACDELLWTFDDRAFVPHEISRDEQLDRTAARRCT